ncbi:Zn-dependent amino-or carboxypeptidase, M28 family [Catalinimonas alkaloidigena]|uniref:Zn-dependent amino-or carboxypeptidase, M28 family n=1 Tax=Catalinimonas alkaloidigena TaxID=1075417 RepID=A0A1G9LR95_9BACT|nr:M28 family metallopeptidase [Catalinimonas alkaloidigena]SDL64271.1 Zn-dependent amino-or carboxypeptidase, M28 family [Catalinimonas alkaloidigena]
MKNFALLALLLACGSACTPTETTSDTETPLDSALTSITHDDLMRHLRVLASDSFEGRGVATPAETLTVDYLTNQFRQLGLKPGNPDGSYVQKVPLMGFTAEDVKASFQGKGKTLTFQYPDQFMGVSHLNQEDVAVQHSEVVFVGYGVDAPEYEWDDYKGMDMTGKTLLMLINDPAVPLEGDTSQLDSTVFRGKAMTYYGRWTYKYEIAAEKGAAAAIIIHETGPAGYPYEVVSGSWGGENFDVQNDPNPKVQVEAWVPYAQAQELVALAGQNLAQLKQAALKRDFQPVPLGVQANLSLHNNLRFVDSHNVVAKLEGSELPDEYVIYTAHWDHLGRDPELEGDQIYNGALDNATGTAGLLELADAYTKLPTPPKRSVLFLAVTAEEKGLLGSKYYATHPLYPLNKTLANLNMDGLNPWGRTRDLVIVGQGNSTLDDTLMKALQQQDRVVVPEDSPEKGYFYRSDHFEFAKEGVPALYTDNGIDYRDQPADYGRQRQAAYVEQDYHKLSDEIKPDWNFAGGVEDLQLLFRVGYDVANGTTYPSWKPGTEFRAKREQMLRQL